MTPDTVASRWRMFGRLGVIALLAIIELRYILNTIAGQRYIVVAQLTLALALMIAMLIVGPTYKQLQSWRAERELRAALNGDMLATPLAETQPDSALALQPGETLTLTRLSRQRYRGAILNLAWEAPLLFAFIAAIGEFLMYLAAPDALGWLAAYMSGPTGMRYPIPPANASLTDWSAFLLPLAAGLIGGGVFVWRVISEQRQEITVNDAGITISRPLSPRQFIAWEDIQLILTLNDDGSGDADYWLRGQRLHATLALATVRPAAKPGDEPLLIPYNFSGGREAYRESVARLVATLTTRARVPVRQWRPWLLRARPTTPNYRKVPELEYIESQPLVPAHAQPTPEEVTRMRAFTDWPLTLHDRFPVRRLAPKLWRNAALGVLSAAIVAAGSGTFAWLSSPPTSAQQSQRAIATLLSLPVAIFLLYVMALGATMGIWIAWASFRDKNPVVIATSEGIAPYRFNNQERALIAWEDIRAWAIHVSDANSPTPSRYVVLANTRKLEWSEPPDVELAGRDVEGDKSAAYRERARQLHALIVARTDLKPREIQTRSGRAHQVG